MPAVVDSRGNTKVMLLPKSTLEGAEESGNVRIISLKHPRTEESAMFVHNSKTQTVQELISFSEDNRSWFIGEKVVSDGQLFMATPVDPTFLILPYLISAERLVPLDHLLTDSQYPEVDILSNMNKGLDKVADQTGSKDLNVWKYSEEKCLSWLEGRVSAVQQVLEAQKIDLTQGAAALSYNAANQPQLVEYARYAFGIVSQYLPGTLADKLKARLNLPEPEKAPTAPKPASAKRQSEGGENIPPGKKRKQAEEPVEDYSKGAAKVVAKEPELNSKQKALAKSAEGSKNIMSFFKKK